MKFRVEFNCYNASFEPDVREAIKNVLTEVANEVALTNSMNGKVCDYNGNVVGDWKIIGH